ncbi:diguanylate cyclase [Maritimibacter alexandrii]|uniref:diguanylate cyclase n=1 Tax=Maritimibacter alexandrii TaxID=2570355 RepID=UPI001109D3A3|nr:diguanylate cyclase [Maritimibacter alexandrii]
MGGRIIIADDLVTDRIALKARLAAARHSVTQARTRDELLTRAIADKPDVILIDIDFPGGGIAACRALKARPDLAEVPVVIYGAADDRVARIAALEAGAEECLTDLPGEALLLALLRNLTRKRAEREELLRRQPLGAADAFAEASAGFAPRARITVVPPTATEGPGWRSRIAAASGAKVTLATSATALEPEAEGDAYVIALTPGNPGAALGLVAELRARPSTRHALVLLHTPRERDDTADMAFDFGADAVMRGAFSSAELAARLDRLLDRKRETDRLRARVEDQLDEALRDPLTGLFNRRYADGYLARMQKEHGGTRRSCAMLLLDLDHFKSVNDRFGHLAGDDVLVETARRLKATLREIDLVARIGGEEFLVVLRDTTGDEARLTAERLRAAVADTPVDARDGQTPISVTLSIGMALCSSAISNPRELWDQADRALYVSKAGGRNIVTCAPERSAA